MKYAAALVALAGTALALPQPQGVTQDLKPTAAAPSGCQPTCTSQLGSPRYFVFSN